MLLPRRLAHRQGVRRRFLNASIGALSLGCGSATQLRFAPPWAWNATRFPSMWFGANATGLDSPLQLQLLAQHALVGYGWQQGTVLNNYQHGEASLANASLNLASYGQDTPPLFVYRHSQIAFVIFDLPRAFSAASHDVGFILSRDDGHRCEQPTPGNATSALYDWTSPVATSFWLSNVTQELVGEVASAGAAAVFLDEGDWNICGYSFAKINCSVAPDELLQNQASKDVMYAAMAGTLTSAGMWALFSFKNWLAAAYGGLPAPPTPPCLRTFDDTMDALANVSWSRFEEFWMGKSAAVDAVQIASTLLQGARGVPVVARTQLPSNYTCGQAEPPVFTYGLAAFLIVLQPYAYFGASTGWYDANFCWHDAYDALYGEPLAPAVRISAFVWTRNFTLCDVAVDTQAGVGDIRMH